MNREIWKPVKGYEGQYEVSNLGGVRSVDRIVPVLNGRLRHIKGKPITPHKSNTGYYLCDLYKENRRKNVLLHRMVAEAFIPNENNLPCVNHIDNNRENCISDNLEWCTQSYNMKYSYDTTDRKSKMNWKSGRENKNSKPVLMYSRDGIFIKRFDCICDAERELGILNNSIVACLKNRYKTAGGYIWKYAESFSEGNA